MLAQLSKAFGLSTSKEKLLGATRSANLSGNILSFGMPENFSRDLPADPMIETVDLEICFSDTPLITRWWGVKKAGFLGSNLGALMMNISVLKVPENRLKKIHQSPYDITKRVDLIFAIDESLHQRYRTNKESLYNFAGATQLFGSEISTPYRDNIFNQQKWTSYSVNGPDHLLIVNHVIPLSKETYIEVSFNFSPNRNVLPRKFREAAYKITEQIEASLYVEFKPSNPMKNIVEIDWLKATTIDAITDQRHDIIHKLFGQKHLDRILRTEKQTPQHQNPSHNEVTQP